MAYLSEGRLCLVCREEKVPMTAPHGSEDLCTTWDLPELPLPSLEGKQCGSSTPNQRRFKKKKKHPAACCSLVFSECGAGALGAFPFLLQPRTGTDSQGQRLLREPPDPSPARSPRRGWRTTKPVWRWTPGRRSRAAEAPEPAPRAVRGRARPPLLPRTLHAPSRRSGLGLRGASTNHE